MNMLIVEGPDASGKTTLVDAIQKEFGLKVGERGTRDRDKLYAVTRQDTHRALAHAVECKGSPLIWDRLFYSDFVYAPIQGRPIAFTENETAVIQALIDILSVPIIICLPSLVEVERNALKDHQMPGVRENLGAIWNAYAKMFMPNGLFHKPNVFPALWYDYTGVFQGKGKHEEGSPWTDQQDAVFGHIDEYLELRGEREPWAS